MLHVTERKQTTDFVLMQSKIYGSKVSSSEHYHLFVIETQMSFELVVVIFLLLNDKQEMS